MRRFLLCLLILLAGACSARGAIESLTAPEDRAFAQEVVDRLRRGDQAWLQRHFHPDLWAQSGKQLAEVPALFPPVPGATEIVSFNVSRSATNGHSETRREVTLVTHGGGRWTVTSFGTYASGGGPEQLVQWQVTPHDSEPPELAMLNAMDRMLPWFWGGLLVVLLAVAGLVFWLVRRSRRRAQARGTP